jgi:hypothetical protein
MFRDHDGTCRLLFAYDIEITVVRSYGWGEQETDQGEKINGNVRGE